jgi:hypothetical protein
MNNQLYQQEDIQKLAEEKKKQIAKFHYGKKEQVELASFWNQANRWLQLEIEANIEKNKYNNQVLNEYFNFDGTLNETYLEKRLDGILEFLMDNFIKWEQQYKNKYWDRRDEIKQLKQ